ncbi:MAG: hypothetical protein AAFZ18_10275 [Myxococcota bacterium]
MLARLVAVGLSAAFVASGCQTTGATSNESTRLQVCERGQPTGSHIRRSLCPKDARRMGILARNPTTQPADDREEYFHETETTR